MGVDAKKKRPALPAPTESESIISAAPTDVATDVSRPADENSSYSLPEDGTPVTFKTRGHSANRSQTSLLIEYFEGGKSPSAESPENRKPSVRVRLKPSSSRKDDRILISKPKSSSQTRKASLSRRSTAAQKSSTAARDGDAAGSAISGSGADGEDSRSINSYASATEESNVSRNIVVEIERSSHRQRPRRPTSPLIPTTTASRGDSSYLPGAQSEISAIPADSFLDGSKSPRSNSPTRDIAAAAITAAAATAAGAAGAAALQRHRVPSSGRSEDKERAKSSSSSKIRDRDMERDSRRHKSSRSRTSSIGNVEREETGSPSHRRSSRHRHHNDSTVSGPDNSVLSSTRSYDQYSVRSGTSKASSINNPKLLETVEDAIRRLILPQLTALKEEQQQLRGYKGVRASSTSSLSREDNDRRRSGASERTRTSRRDSRDREGRHLDDSPSPAPREESYAYDSGNEAGAATRSINSTPQRSTDKLKMAMAGAAGAGLAGLAAAAIADHDKSPTVARDQRRRLRAEARSRGVEDSQQLPVNQPQQQEHGPPGLYLSEAYSATSHSSEDMTEGPESATGFRSVQGKQYLEPDGGMLRPPMPLMSEINSDVTRTSILSAESDRPRSASEELRETIVHEKTSEDPAGQVSGGDGSRGAVDFNTQAAAGTLQALGVQHANVSHGDLRALPRKAVPTSSIYPSATGEHEETTSVEQQRGFEGHQQSQQQYMDPEAEDEYDEEYDSVQGYGGPTYDSYGNQIVPAPLNYVPYQPEHRGLSPIPSVSGYTEGGASEVQGYRDSGLTAASISSPGKSPNPDPKAISSPNSVLSNVKSREFDPDNLSVHSSDVDYRPAPTQLTDDGSLVNPSSIRAFEGAGANPNFVHTPVGVESAVASLVDGSMLDGSALTGDSSRTGEYAPAYDPRRSVDDRFEEEQSYDRASANARSVESHQQSLGKDDGRDDGSRDFHDIQETRDVSASSPTTTRTNPSEFAGEFEIDAYGRKVRRPSPTASQTAAITAGAIDLAIQAARDRNQQPLQEDQPRGEAGTPTADEWVPVGVQRNKSFKERAMDGHLPANTPTRSTDRLDEYDLPRLGASGLPDMVNPLPEIGYGYQEDDLETNPSVADERSVHTEQDNWRAGDRTPTQETQAQHDRGLGFVSKTGAADNGLASAVGAAGAAAVLAASSQHTRQVSQERDDEWQRSSDERKRDTLITNPYEGTSPIVNETLIKSSLSKPASGTAPSAGATAAATAAAAAAAAAFGTAPAEYSPRSPLGGRFDEGYISQGPGKSPDLGVTKGKGMDFVDTAPVAYGAEENPFYAPNQTRHFSGLSQGMASPLYDAATGAGIDRIENKDIVALMQHLMVRDAQRSARDTEILVTLVRAASEIRSSFEDVRTMLAMQEKGINNEFSKKIADSEDAIITEILDGTEKTMQMHIKGLRQPPPASGARSLYGTVSQPDTDDTPVKRQNFFRRALKLLDAKGNNDLSRIEDMLNQLLTQVDVLKAQSAEGAGPGGVSAAPSTHLPSPYDGMIDAQLPYEHDRGYEPEGHAGTSTTASQSQSGFLSVNSRAGPTPLSKMGGGYERKFSDNRISTVPEDNEDELEYAHAQGAQGMGAGNTGAAGGNVRFDNPTASPLMSSAFLATPPPQQTRATQGYEQQEQEHRDLLQQPDQQQTRTPQQQQALHSNENTPRTDKAKKHKSGGSSSWFPKISRWSETTTSSVGRVFRSSRDSKKDHDELGFHSGASRSRSDVASYDGYEHDASDKLHTGFSAPDLHDNSYLGSPAQQQQQRRQQEQQEQQRQEQEAQRARQFDEDLYGYERAHVDSTEILPPHPKTFMTPEDPKYRAHRDSLNLQHPQPRSGQPFKAALESRAEHFDSSMSPRSADWAGSATSLRRFPEQNMNRYSDGSATNATRSSAQQQQQQQNWGAGTASSTPAQAKPPRPPKEPLDEQDLRQQETPPRPARLNKAMKTSPLPYHSVEGGYGTATQAATSYTGSPRLENRNLSGALTVPTRRPSGPRAMTPKSDRSMRTYNEEDPGSDPRRRKRGSSTQAMSGKSF